MEPPNAPLAGVLRFGRFELRTANRQLLADGQPVEVGARALDVLIAIVERSGRLVTKEELLDLAWPGLVVEENNLSVQISSLRRILGAGAIVTVPGRGYQFALDLSREATGASQALTARKHNLPERVTSFVGRETDLSRLRELLEDRRLVTLIGLGGVGKTRLSLRVAADSTDKYTDGVWLAEFAPLVGSRSVPQELARVLDVREDPDGDLLSPLVKTLRDKNVLLLFDNCEHVLVDSARMCDALLAACPRLRILATSREALRVAGEATFRVLPLAVPDHQTKATVDALMCYAAARLFVDRAVAVRSSFQVDEQNCDAIASICRRLDGIPLALELAAARVSSMSVQDIHERLDERFRLLTRGARSALPRQQTLRAAIDWSYDLLTATERALLRRLSVFSGSFTLVAAEQVCYDTGVDATEALDSMAALVDKSLLLMEERPTTRYRFLETVQQYARDRLREEEGEAQWRHKHLAHFLALAEQAASHLRGEDQQAWLDRLEAEHDNLRAALMFASSAGSDAVGGLRLAVAISRFWSVRGHFAEGRSWLSTMVAAMPDGAADPLRARALNESGYLAWQQSDYVASRALHERALALSRFLDDPSGVANSLSALGLVAKDQNQYELARTLQEESLSIQRRLGNRRGIAVALANLATVYGELGRFSTAQAHFAESSEIFRAIGDKQNIAMSLHSGGYFAYQQGNYAVAQAQQEQSLALWRELGDKRGISLALGNLGLTVAAQGNLALAQSLQEESLAVRRALGDRRGIAISLSDLAEVLLDRGDRARARALYRESLSISGPMGDRLSVSCALDGLAACLDEPHQAAVLWGGAERLRQEINVTMPPSHRPRHDARVAQSRGASEDVAAFDAGWRRGAAMKTEQLTEYALDPDPQAGR